MTKYFLRDGHKEVQLGDKVTISTPVNTPYGKGVATVDVELSKTMLKVLVEDGFILREYKGEKPQVFSIGEHEIGIYFDDKEDAKVIFTVLKSFLQKLSDGK